MQAALSALHFKSPFESLPILGAGNVKSRAGLAPQVRPPPTKSPSPARLGRVTDANRSRWLCFSGGGSTATVSTSAPVQNLTLIGSEAGTVGASADGHRVYFFSAQQLVSGLPPIAFGRGLLYWQDAEGPPGGTISSSAL